jgi:hypothetical protein
MPERRTLPEEHAGEKNPPGRTCRREEPSRKNMTERRTLPEEHAGEVTPPSFPER